MLQMLIILPREIVIQRSGEERQQHGKPAEQEKERIRPKRKAQGLFGLHRFAHGKHPCGKRAKRRRREKRHGCAADQAAHAAKQSVVDKQF